ncbi:MAG: hypothetical protein IGS16_07980 [Thermoleptolyngbya sp. C42_A2020_037]|nr:hypothetical protein [Thermoleptolyngbya sp. C42_A2020_037]
MIKLFANLSEEVHERRAAEVWVCGDPERCCSAKVQASVGWRCDGAIAHLHNP